MPILICINIKFTITRVSQEWQCDGSQVSPVSHPISNLNNGFDFSSNQDKYLSSMNDSAVTSMPSCIWRDFLWLYEPFLRLRRISGALSSGLRQPMPSYGGAEVTGVMLLDRGQGQGPGRQRESGQQRRAVVTQTPVTQQHPPAQTCAINRKSQGDL